MQLLSLLTDFLRLLNLAYTSGTTSRLNETDLIAQENEK